MNPMKQPFRKLLLPAVSLVSILLASCANQTPQTRIEQNPKILASLPASQQKAVQSGSIIEGMTKNAVFLAWGNPDKKYENFSEGKKTEKWLYTKLRPVYSQRVSGVFGYGYRNYRYRGFYPGFGLGTTVSYLPAPAASVIFTNDKVSSWQSEQ